MEIGCKHPNYLDIDSDEFTDWLAFYVIEPYGDERADMRSAIVASVMANAWRDKGAKASTPEDFMPFYVRREQTPEEMQRIVASFLGT